jgi:hypothetical protein
MKKTLSLATRPRSTRNRKKQEKRRWQKYIDRFEMKMNAAKEQYAQTSDADEKAHQAAQALIILLRLPQLMQDLAPPSKASTSQRKLATEQTKKLQQKIDAYRNDAIWSTTLSPWESILNSLLDTKQPRLGFTYKLKDSTRKKLFRKYTKSKPYDTDEEDTHGDPGDDYDDDDDAYDDDYDDDGAYDDDNGAYDDDDDDDDETEEEEEEEEEEEDVVRDFSRIVERRPV